MGQEADNEILLTIKISEEEVEKKVLAAREALVRLNKEYVALRKELDANIITEKEFAKSQQAIEKQIAAANKQVRDGNKILDQYSQAQKKAEQTLANMRLGLTKTGDETALLQKRISDLAAEFAQEAADANHAGSSIDKLDEKIATLRTEYDGLTKAQRENKEIGGVLLNQIDKLEKAQDKNNKTVDDSKKGVKEYIEGMEILGVSVGGAIASFKSGVQGVKAFASAIFTSRGALIALTAIPIIALLSGLYLLLTKSQKGMDFLAQATSAVSAVFGVLTDKIISITSAFLGLFTNTKQTLIDLGNFIQAQLINRFTAFGVILDAIRSGDFKKLADGLAQMSLGIADATGKAQKFATEIGNAASAGANLAKAAQAIEEGEIKLNVQRGKSLVLIEKNKQLSEDTSKSAATRIAAAKKAYSEEEKLQRSEQDLQLKRIALAKQQGQIEAKNGVVSRENRKKISEEEEKYEQIAADAIGKRTEIQNNLNSIQAEATAKALENAKKAAKEQVDQAEAALVVAKRNGEDTIEIEEEVYKRTIELIQKRRDAELVGVKKGSNERKLIIAKAATEELEAAKALAIQIADITLKARNNQIETDLAFSQRGSEQELNLRIKSIGAERDKQLAIAKATIKDKQKLLDEETRITSVAARQISDARQAFDESEVNREADAAARRLQTELDLGDQTVEAERNVAAKRIDLEETTQKKLLDIQLEYGQISDKEYLNRINAVESRALAQRKELAKQRLADERANQLAIVDMQLEIVRDGTKAQLAEQKKKLKLEREAAIEAAKGNKDLIEQINKTYDKKEIKAQEDHNKKLFDQVTTIAQQAIATLSTVVDAQSTAALAALDEQQAAILASAALSADQRAKIEDDFAKKKQAIEDTANAKKKKVATAENAINTALSITKAFAELGPIGGAIATALILAQAAAQQVIIDNQSFASGGYYRSDNKGAYVTGPGTGKSDSINARISNGEAIINAESTRKHYQLLSDINVSGGGRAFPGVMKYAGPTFSREYVQPRFAYGGVGGGFDTQAIANAIVQGMRQVDISIGVDEISKKQKNAARVREGGDIKRRTTKTTTL